MQSLLEALNAPIQELFDVSGERLLRQGTRSCTSVGSCVYDNGEGLHCAVGLLMSKSEIESAKSMWLNGNSVDELVGAEGLNYNVHGNLGKLNFLCDLQNLHDSTSHTDPSSWRWWVVKGLRELAEKYDVNTNRITEVYNEVAA